MIAEMPSNPEHILITGGAGFLGQVLAASFLRSSPSLILTLTDVVVPPIPKTVSQQDAQRIHAYAHDLTNSSVVSTLLDRRFSAVYLLHGLMSGGAEANLELGWKVNWDSHRAILDYLRLNYEGTVVVFPSSLAVYGPPTAGIPTSEKTCPEPQSSYGAQKLMVETYLNDMSRRGLLDGRVVRLPTIIVRPGAPSAAASSFCSGIVREPLKGEVGILPVSRSMSLWVCSAGTVIENLIRVRKVSTADLGKSRVINLPGITVTVDEILEALRRVGGEKALALVKEERDVKVEAIVGSWPAVFDVSRAKKLGMVPDVSLEENVRRFVADHSS